MSKWAKCRECSGPVLVGGEVDLDDYQGLCLSCCLDRAAVSEKK
jgi:hypothetical protein